MAITRPLAISIVVGAAVIAVTSPAFAASPAPSHGNGAVFVQTDNLQHNSVVSFARSASGAVTRVGVFRTGGQGGVETDAPVDSLASQNSLTYDPLHSLLFAVNAGSDTVTAFAVDGTQLTRLQIVPSGGQFPVSVAVHGRMLYVLNAGGAGRVTGYRIATNRRLTGLPGAHRSLKLANQTPPNFLTAPADIVVTPDGRHVVVTTKANNTVDVLNINSTGGLAAAIPNVSAGTVPFAVAFGQRGRLVVANAGGSTVSTYTVSAGGRLRTITAGVADGQAALCWIVGAHRTFYGANAGSSTISAFAVRRDGTVVLTGTPDGVVAQPIGAGGTIDLAITRDGTELFAQNSFDGSIAGYRIEPDSTLTLVSTASGLPKFDGHGMEGLVAI